MKTYVSPGSTIPNETTIWAPGRPVAPTTWIAGTSSWSTTTEIATCRSAFVTSSGPKSGNRATTQSAISADPVQRNRTKVVIDMRALSCDIDRDLKQLPGPFGIWSGQRSSRSPRLLPVVPQRPTLSAGRLRGLKSKTGERSNAADQGSDRGRPPTDVGGDPRKAVARRGHRGRRRGGYRREGAPASRPGCARRGAPGRATARDRRARRARAAPRGVPERRRGDALRHRRPRARAGRARAGRRGVRPQARGPARPCGRGSSERDGIHLPPARPRRHSQGRVGGCGVDEARALDPRGAPGGRIEPADREAPLPRGADRQVPPDEHLPEARGRHAHRSTALRVRARARRAAALVRRLAARLTAPKRSVDVSRRGLGESELVLPIEGRGSQCAFTWGRPSWSRS